MDNKVWFNQMLFYHKDSEFNSDGIIELSISNYTSDYKSFSTPNLIISITNGNSRRSFTLNYQNSYDLLESLIFVLRNNSTVYSDNKTYEIFKKYHYDRSLKIEFRKSMENQIVIIFIYYNQSDFGKIVITYKLFETFCRLIKHFAEEYIKIGLSISSRSISSEILEQIKSVSYGIKTIPSLMNQQINFKNTEQDVPDSILKISEDNISELDSFMSETLNKIELPEEKSIPIETKQESQLEIPSKFLDKVLNKDLTVLENLITSASVSQNPIISISDTIKKKIGIDLLDGISEKDLKSSLYISKLIYLTSMNCYTDYNVPIPSSFPIIKAKVSATMNQDNSDVIFDLLTFSTYVRCVRNKLESKINDAIVNKAIFYMGLRCFTDIFVYSFLDSVDPNVIKSCVLNRFKCYKNKKIFENYNELLTSYGCSSVSEREIEDVINILISKVIGKTKFIDELHNEMYSENIVKLSSNNNLNTEQIIKVLVPAEVFIRIGNKIEDYHEDLSDDIIEILKVKEEKKEMKKKEPKKNNLYRYIKTIETEIPDKYRKEFMTYVEKLSGSFDYKMYNLNECGDKVVKAIYEWNESNKTEKYTDFYDRCENSLMSKELILAKLSTKTEEKSEDWFGNLSIE